MRDGGIIGKKTTEVEITTNAPIGDATDEVNNRKRRTRTRRDFNS